MENGPLKVQRVLFHVLAILKKPIQTEGKHDHQKQWLTLGGLGLGFGFYSRKRIYVAPGD